MPSASVRVPAAWHVACSCSRLEAISAAERRFRSFVPAMSSTCLGHTMLVRPQRAAASNRASAAARRGRSSHAQEAAALVQAAGPI
eukprot:scaffold119120_cov63-Phaeocystis_antarctica.AAC.2